MALTVEIDGVSILDDNYKTGGCLYINRREWIHPAAGIQETVVVEWLVIEVLISCKKM